MSSNHANTSRENSKLAHRTMERTIEDPFGEMQRVTVNLGESPLLWLRARDLISERLYMAGDVLRRDWELAGLGPRVTMAWDSAPASRQRGVPSGGFMPSERSLSAKKRFNDAITAAGPGLADILWRVVCAGEGLSAAEQALGWPSRAAKLVLSFALHRVADFYRIK